jgi:hypothetical protein
MPKGGGLVDPLFTGGTGQGGMGAFDLFCIGNGILPGTALLICPFCQVDKLFE